MFPYWLLFAFFAIGTLTAHARVTPAEPYRSPILVLAFVVTGLMIGTRYWVGLDWNNYLWSFNDSTRGALVSAIGRGDPAYVLLNRLVIDSDGPFWIVNLVCASIFCWGLYRFVKTQPEPWLTTLVAVPYLIVVVAMGYTRQAVAIGLILGGLAELCQGRSFLRFLPYILIGTLFHSSAIFTLPLAMIGVKSGTLSRWLLVPAAAFGLYSLTLADHIERYREYIGSAMQSEGAAIRIVLTVIPAILFFATRRKLAFNPVEAVIWRNYALAAFALLILLFISPSSTAVDRIGLYLVPLQLAVLGRAPLLLNSRLGGRVAIIGYSGIILFVWLNFAQFAHGWIPYRTYFSPGFEERRSRVDA